MFNARSCGNSLLASLLPWQSSTDVYVSTQRTNWFALLACGCMPLAVFVVCRLARPANAAAAGLSRKNITGELQYITLNQTSIQWLIHSNEIGFDLVPLVQGYSPPEKDPNAVRIQPGSIVQVVRGKSYRFLDRMQSTGMYSVYPHGWAAWWSPPTSCCICMGALVTWQQWSFA